ncbi:MucR family transcriptional regulator [Phenylobacterium sp. LH3H17]|uniref:MucR family transcriptional regulator n=1 Tax=Phenylobacterium sp. LH3H17 TaxID=2903901 RepID=UPI0020CA00C3|nr:MucR family transcriptional regulator [Phenylobacterium sp. LH3H17]UTP38251.1 MucR family transcriptional regulator [Phenylobacterium sp. LH3H17]
MSDTPPLGSEFLMAKQSVSLDATVGIVSAYLSRNSVAPVDLPNLVQLIHRAIAAACRGSGVPPSMVQTPAVAIRKSITPEHLICLEDGRRFKSLKRHLRTKFNLSPDQYRAKWNLPTDYPMVAPSSAAARSLHARSVGQGRGGRRPADAPVEADPDAQGE